MHSAAEESDTWQDLPEFDADLDDPASDEPVEVTLEISELDESDALDRDDSNAQDLDVGVELDLTLDTAQDAGGHDLVLDIGQLLDAQEEQAADQTDDAAGPLDEGATADVPELDERAAAADEDLDADLDDDGLDEALPGMDADEEGDFGEDVSSLWSSDEFVADETLPAWSAQRWAAEGPVLDARALAAITCAQGNVVAGGQEILWQQGERTARLAVDSGSVVSLALGGSRADSVLYVTALGRLLRRRAGGAVEHCDAWRSCEGMTSSRAVVLELSQPSARAPNTVLLRTSTGSLLCSEDFGASFFTVPAPGDVVALSQASDPAWVLVESRTGLTLAEVNVPGRSLRQVPLDRAAELVARGQSLKLAASGSLVAIADEARGVAVSYDAGKSFSLVAGTSNASAWTAGEHAGSTTLWLSVVEESTSRSWILRVTRGLAERVAELGGRAPAGPGRAPEGVEESSDNVRISALCWDDASSLLWGVGGFGIVSWRLPKDGNE
ncbi:MAG TPA: hypothetical protein VI072_12770 [Polyangiaceae bacterium]